MVDQNATHDGRRQGEEMGPVLPAYLSLIDQF
jgi:hypothetical protein